MAEDEKSGEPAKDKNELQIFKVGPGICIAWICKYNDLLESSCIVSFMSGNVCVSRLTLLAGHLLNDSLL